MRQSNENSRGRNFSDVVLGANDTGYYNQTPGWARLLKAISPFRRPAANPQAPKPQQRKAQS